MQKNVATTALNSALNPALADFVAREDAIADAADRAGVTGETLNSMYAMRHAADFLEHASELIAAGRKIGGPAVMQWFRWAVMKVIEANGALPEHLRGDLSYECFQRPGSAAGQAH